MRVDPLSNTSYSTGSKRMQGDASARINTTDSFQRSEVPEPSMKNLAGTLFGKGKELTDLMRNSEIATVKSAFDNEDKTTIQIMSVPKKDGEKIKSLLTMSDGTLVSIRGRELGTSGKQGFSVVFMKPTMGEKAEITLNTNDSLQTDLMTTPDGRVLARDGDEWKCFSSDGKEMWKTPFMDIGLFGNSFSVANDGTAINWSKDEKNPNADGYKVSALTPDGALKWEKPVTLSFQQGNSQHVDPNGNIYLYSEGSSTCKKIDVNGNETEIEFTKGQIPSGAKIHNFETTESGKVIIQMRMDVPDGGFGTRTVYPKYLMEPGKAPSPLNASNFEPPESIIDGPDGSLVAIARKDNYHSQMLFFDKDGKKAWEKELPFYSSKNKPFVDNQGRIIVISNSVQRPVSMSSGFPPPESAITCYDKDGNSLWQHKMNRKFHADQAMIFPDKSVVLTDSFLGQVMRMNPGETTGEQMVNEILKDSLAEGKTDQKQETIGIQKADDGKSINIGGVKLPIRQFRFASDGR